MRWAILTFIIIGALIDFGLAAFMVLMGAAHGIVASIGAIGLTFVNAMDLVGLLLLIIGPIAAILFWRRERNAAALIAAWFPLVLIIVVATIFSLAERGRRAGENIAPPPVPVLA